MKEIEIRKETLAKRCEICHKEDKFDGKTNQCLRCQNIVSKTLIKLSENEDKKRPTDREIRILLLSHWIISIWPIICLILFYCMNFRAFYLLGFWPTGMLSPDDIGQGDFLYQALLLSVNISFGFSCILFYVFLVIQALLVSYNLSKKVSLSLKILVANLLIFVLLIYFDFGGRFKWFLFWALS